MEPVLGQVAVTVAPLIEGDVGEEALVALQEAPALQGVRGIAWARA